MSLNPAGATNFNWNYSNPERPNFSLELWGTVVSVQEVQARMFNPGGGLGRPATWPDGKPKMNIRVGLATPEGELKSVTMARAGRDQAMGKKPSLHMDLFKIAGGVDMYGLIGKTIHLWTWPVNPNTNQPWGQGNPRLFGVEEVTTGEKYQLNFDLPREFTVESLYADDGVSGGQPVAPAPQQIYPPQVPMMQGQYYQQPQPQYAPQQYAPQSQQYAPQPQYVPQQQYAPQPAMPQQMSVPQQPMQPAPQTAPMPAGIDPAVAAAMQAVGAVNVQPTDSSVYDDDMPF